MSEHHAGPWGGRDNAVWWPSADQQQAMHQQQMMQQHQQQMVAQHNAAVQQQQHNAAVQQQQQQQQQQHNNVQHNSGIQHNSQQQQNSSDGMQQFSYKMASSFQNPATTVSNVSSTSPVGAAGVRGYDYRLGGNMTGGNPAMGGPAPQGQWWNPQTMDYLQSGMQQSNMQNMHTPPPVVGIPKGPGN